MSKLVVLGSVNADHVLQVGAFPHPDETLHGHSYDVIPGSKPDEAIRFAHAAAAITVTRPDAQTSIPHLKEVAHFLAEYNE